MVRITAEAVVPPAEVDRVPAGMAETAEPLQVDISDSSFLERALQRVPLELRVVPRPGYSPDISQKGYRVDSENPCELLGRSRGVPYRVDGRDIRHDGLGRAPSYLVLNPLGLAR